MPARTNAVIFGRDATDGVPKAYNYNRGAMDVYMQDQATPLVNHLFTLKANNVTLATPAVRDAYTLDLVAGHSASVGQVINILGETRIYQGIILNVAVNTITVDSPLPFAFPITSTAFVGTVDASVNGTTRKIFTAKPPSNVAWDIMELSIFMVDTRAMDDTTFAGIPEGVGPTPPLTNGVVLRARNSAWYNIGNVKRNGDFKAVGCSTAIASKVGGGEYSFNAICEFRNDAGVVLRIDGRKGDQLELLIQDDLTSITRITAAAIGHVVE